MDYSPFQKLAFSRIQILLNCDIDTSGYYSPISMMQLITKSWPGEMKHILSDISALTAFTNRYMI